MKMIPY